MQHSPAFPPPAASSPPSAPRRGRRAAIIGTAAVAAAGVAVTAVLMTRGGDEPADPAEKPAAAPRSAASTTPPSTSASPDPLASSAAMDPNAPLGGDPKVPDNTTKAQSDASTALASWSSSNPKSSGSHAVGGDTTTGGGGKVAEVLRIPTLGDDWKQPVYEGVGDRQLRAGVGHFPGTESPGQIGNYSLAGHRSGVASPAFKDIDRVQPGTTITVTTANRITYTYKVSKVSTVVPTEVNVIAQVPGKPQETPTKAMLTLVTCWPANGHSKRVVVNAELVGSNGGTAAR
ncbi:sortase [Streptomyces abikoensis]|uniref:sortase n=1 Tax=Streptomyces abikoensis TaxID=97398 RepID=UPI0033E5C40A